GRALDWRAGLSTTESFLPGTDRQRIRSHHPLSRPSNRRGRFPSWTMRSTIVITALAATLAGLWWLRRPNLERLVAEAKRALDRNDTNSAIANLDAVLRSDPAHALARLYRGQIARDAGDLEAAFSHWSQVGDAPARTGATARYLQGML